MTSHADLEELQTKLPQFFRLQNLSGSGRRDREVQITNSAVLLCTLLRAYVLEYARSATKLGAAKQSKESTRPLGRRVVCQVSL